jgi:hypothetical protein
MHTQAGRRTLPLKFRRLATRPAYWELLALVMENIEDDFFVRKTEKTRNAVPAGSQIAKNKVTI